MVKNKRLINMPITSTCMKHKEHHARELVFLMALLVLFALFLLVGVVNIRRGLPVFGIGIGYFVEDGLIILLSFLAVLRILWQIVVH